MATTDITMPPSLIKLMDDNSSFDLTLNKRGWSVVARSMDGVYAVPVDNAKSLDAVERQLRKWLDSNPRYRDD